MADIIHDFAARASHPIPDSDVNPALQVTSWLLLGLTSLLIGFRLLSRFFIVQGSKFTREDIFVLVSFILGLGGWITMVIPESRVFGKTIYTISPEDLIAGLKVGFARDILFVLCLGFSKLAVCAGLLALSPDINHRYAILITATLIALLTTISLFATAFQCGAQGPWELESTTCFNEVAFWTYHAVTSIFTDAVLIAIPMVIIYPLNMALKMRIVILAFYACRIVVIASTILLLIYLPRILEEDFTYKGYPYYLSQLFVQFTSISASCIVYFWPLLRSLQSGLMQLNNSSALTSHYPLAMVSASHPSGLGSNGLTENGQGTHRREYIKITTGYSVDISNKSSGQEQHSEYGNYNRSSEL
ncbi:hypothetical protein F4777DRAFT_552144 [Nemania sp. FL0916]|nr:hypothetical protein F4777DRAFT_552144 [Nemania sp. FL0916]